MISLTTHTLDSSTGAHAAGVNVKLFAIADSKFVEIWERTTDEGGRLAIKFEIEPQYKNCELQLSFNIADYFVQSANGVQAQSVNLNIMLPNPNGSYHLPIIISPHGASLWWSN